MADLLSKLDGDDCGCRHEETFSTQKLASTKWWRAGWWFADQIPSLDKTPPGESSWLVVPYLAKLPETFVVLHQVRHPLHVIRSICRIPFLRDSTDYTRFAYHFCPEIEGGTSQEERALRYWVRWNQMAEDLSARFGEHYFRYRVEEIDVLKVRQILDLLSVTETAEKAVKILQAHPRNVNTRGDKSRDGELIWAKLPAGIWRDRAEEMAARYGYTI